MITVTVWVMVRVSTDCGSSVYLLLQALSMMRSVYSCTADFDGVFSLLAQHQL